MPIDRAKDRLDATRRGDGKWIITNGSRAVMLPADGEFEPPGDGPIAAVRSFCGQWRGRMTLAGLPGRGHCQSIIESMGRSVGQWRTEYRWGSNGGGAFQVRWPAGSDTLLVSEQWWEDSEAGIEYQPLYPARARALGRGGGVRMEAMRPLIAASRVTTRCGHGRRGLGHLGHVSYWNQWCLSWIGFEPQELAGEDLLFRLGIFSGWGDCWQRRGHMRPQVIEDEDAGHLVRLPLRRGRRRWGLVIPDSPASLVGQDGHSHLLNHRKASFSDLPVQKTSQWELDPPLEAHEPMLNSHEDLSGLRQRIGAEPLIGQRLQEVLDMEGPEHPGFFPAALCRGDHDLMRRAVEPLLGFAEQVSEKLRNGGYERIVIFDGRAAKRHAYTLDALWALRLIKEADYRRVRRVLLALAYVFTDPAFCMYDDFWPHRDDPAEGMVEALKDEMGDCPVPPNFAAEFLTTVGVVAELFPSHPMHTEWRRKAMDWLDTFLDTFFAEDGTYLESVNYHMHTLNEMICHIYPLWIKGVRDYFAHRAIRGSFDHLWQLMTPPLSEGLPDEPAPSKGRSILLDAHRLPYAALPANGNSGRAGRQLGARGDLPVGMRVYGRSAPQLAGRLAHCWRTTGRLICDQEHPLLTLVCLDPSLAPVTPPWESVWRKSLGIISKAEQTLALPVWCLFRAGRATHHMDFDQGHVHLIYGDRVLLGDHGYHTQDSDGTPLPAASTWLHNTVTYGQDRWLSSGYTGLEQAPEPLRVVLRPELDWVVHPVVNDNYRNLRELSYREQINAPTTVHTRRYLFVKPDYILIQDTFEAAHGPATFWLHPQQPVEQLDDALFRCGTEGQPHLAVQFVQPTAAVVVERRQVGPLWCLGVRQEAGLPFVVLLVPQTADHGLVASLDGNGARISIRGDGIDDEVILDPEDPSAPPRLIRRGDARRDR